MCLWLNLRRWFDKKEEDGLIRRRLKVAEVGGENVDYTVTVVTSDIRGAGTDANVFVEIVGERDGVEVRTCCGLAATRFALDGAE